MCVFTFQKDSLRSYKFMKMTLKDEVFLCASPSFSGIRYSFKETARERAHALLQWPAYRVELAWVDTKAVKVNHIYYRPKHHVSLS
jgi:hypothetical protein